MSHALIDVNRIRAFFFDRKVEKMIKRANKLHTVTNKRFIVLLVGDRPRIYSKKQLRTMCAQKKFTVKLDELTKHAIHITGLRHDEI